MKTRNVILIIVGIFLLAAGVVVYVLRKTDATLKDAQLAADKAKGVTSDVKDLGMYAKKTWEDIRSIVF